MSDQNDLGAFLDEAWRHLIRGVADKLAPARHPTIATVSPEGLPEARTVVLRAAIRDRDMLEVHTDSATAKFRSLQQTPQAALLVWAPRARLQIRLTATVEIITGAAAETRWAKVPSKARVSYGTEPDSGTPIAQSDAYDTPSARARFAVLCCRVDAMDLLHLETPHRRAVFRRDDSWRGAWVAP